MPEAGKPIPKEGIVVLYTEEAEEPTAKVPDFKGKTLAEANKLAADAGINLQFSGVGLENGEAKGGDQSVAAGHTGASRHRGDGYVYLSGYH